MVELKPCPFCGSKAEIVEDREFWPDAESHFYPTCTSEDMIHTCPGEEQPDGEFNSVHCSFKTYEKAVEVWNRRSGD